MSDWRTRLIANEANKAIGHSMTQGAMEEYADNMGFDPKVGLPAYGMIKIAMYAAQVARAQALGIDPELLRESRQPLSRAEVRAVCRALRKAGLSMDDPKATGTES